MHAQDFPHSLRIPGTFANDHLERNNDGAFVVSRGRTWIVRMNDAALLDLSADASYYATDVDQAPEAIVASARRTVAALKRQGFEG